jgi:hypothetical protein
MFIVEQIYTVNLNKLNFFVQFNVQSLLQIYTLQYCCVETVVMRALPGKGVIKACPFNSLCHSLVIFHCLFKKENILALSLLC